MKSKIKILCVGEEWKGSNASGLFYAFSRLGFVTNVVNEQAYITLKSKGVISRIINKSVRGIQILAFNESLKHITDLFNPTLVFIYKGGFLKPETIIFWKQKGIPVVNFFPDVSFMAHGRYIPLCMPHYDHIFTTKTFAAADLNKAFDYPKNKISFVPHGYDPLVHRPWTYDVNDTQFKCDVSFIGGYTPSKWDYLDFLSKRLDDESFFVWGNGWNREFSEQLGRAIKGQSIFGDLYAYAIGMSSVNIALLSEQVVGASSGDLITSRTFHIPGSGGFMLHQRNNEVIKYFEEGKEMACFSTKEELVEKAKYYLIHEKERTQIQQAGHKRAVNEHSLDKRALMIIDILQERGLLQ